MNEYIIPQEMNQSDRIGNFTLAQAGVMGGGLLLMLFMFAFLPSMIVALILDIPIGILTVYLMYKKKYNIPVYEFFFVYITYKSMPKLYVFRTNNLKDEYDDKEVLDFIVDDNEQQEEEVL